VKLMVKTGLDAYRLSISWSRLIPNGRGPINPKGLQFYNSSRGDYTTEPYLAIHHILLSHSSAVRLYRRKYKDKQHGFIGIAVYSSGLVPGNDTDEDRAATQRALAQTLFSNEEYPVTPWTLREELNIMKTLYGNPPIFIYENGQRIQRNSSLQDVTRVEYLHGYISVVLDSISSDGSPTLDSFYSKFHQIKRVLKDDSSSDNSSLISSNSDIGSCSIDVT
ncbi:hypothetical protein HN51_044868, partial [Arachis hypogaea]